MCENAKEISEIFLFFLQFPCDREEIDQKNRLKKKLKEKH